MQGVPVIPLALPVFLRLPPRVPLAGPSVLWGIPRGTPPRAAPFSPPLYPGGLLDGQPSPLSIRFFFSPAQEVLKIGKMVT
jgi:hypothetical protein